MAKTRIPSNIVEPAPEQLEDLKRLRDRITWDDQDESDPDADLPPQHVREQYNDTDHVGYTLFGNRILRKSTTGGQSRMDEFLTREDDPKRFVRTVYDPIFDEEHVISREDAKVVRRLTRGIYPGGHVEDEFIRAPSSNGMPLSNTPVPKSRFVPSRHEAKQVAAIRKAIAEGRFRPRAPAPDGTATFDVWADAGDADITATRLRPPRAAPPTHSESYRPPAEYLLTEEEIAAAGEDAFVPKAFEAWRRVPQYDRVIDERFQRCLDLYLCPRAEQVRRQIDPESMLPDLPDPRSLKPYPEKLALSVRRAHHGAAIYAIAVQPRTGQFIATGGQDGTVSIWEAETGRRLATWLVGAERASTTITTAQPGEAEEELVAGPDGAMRPVYDPAGEADLGTNFCAVTGLVWVRAVLGARGAAAREATAEEESAVAEALAGKGIVPDKEESESESEEIEGEEDEEDESEDESSSSSSSDEEDTPKEPEVVEFLVACAGPDLVFISPDVANPAIVARTEAYLRRALGQSPAFMQEDGVRSVSAPAQAGPLLRVRTSAAIRTVDVHPRGDYVVVTHRGTGRTAVEVISAASGKTFCPFSHYHGAVKGAKWSPRGDRHLYVGTEHGVSVYDLDPHHMGLARNLLAPMANAFAIHPLGVHAVVGANNGRVHWFDRERSAKPIQSILHDAPVVTDVSFAQRRPMFATCSTDGSVRVYHGRVVPDRDHITEEIVLAPLKALRGHGLAKCAAFDAAAPWIWTGSSDGVLRLWVNRM